MRLFWSDIVHNATGKLKPGFTFAGKEPALFVDRKPVESDPVASPWIVGLIANRRPAAVQAAGPA